MLAVADSVRQMPLHDCVLQRTSTRFGDRAFGVSGPSVWNSLPTELRQSHISLGQFRRALKRRPICFNRFSVAPSDFCS